MISNKVDKITMQAAKFPRSLVNLSHDSNTTFGFGEVQPLVCKSMLPDSKMVLNMESRVLLAAMNVPTFGRLKLKTTSLFVPAVDIFECWNEYLAKTRYTYGGVTQVPKQEPNAWLSVLGAMCLAGADCSIYFRTLTGGGFDQWFCPTSTKFNNDYASGFNSQFANVYQTSTTFSGNWFDGQTFPTLDLKCMVGDKVFASNNLTNIPVPINAQIFENLLSHAQSDGTVRPSVDITSADYVVEKSFTYNGSTWVVAFAYNLNAFGKRIRKMLIGSGYQVNLDSTTPVSIMPLLASFKAYFDIYNLPQWTNFEDTFCKKLVAQWIIDNPLAGFNPTYGNNALMKLFTEWMTELGSCWYTSSQDYISAHQVNIANSSSYFGLDSFLDVNVNSYAQGTNLEGGGTSKPSTTSNNIPRLRNDFVVSESSSYKNPHARLQLPVHGQLDAELLMKQYKNCNQKSVIGQRVAELLRAMGHGDFVDECKSNFIGSFDIQLKMPLVVSQSDTYDDATSDGEPLGSYGGRGIGYDESDTLVYETKEDGFFVTLGVIVPDSGFAQSVDPSVFAYKPELHHTPDYDGVGMEASRKLVVCGTQVATTPQVDQSNGGSLDDTFGYVPTYSGLKVINNKWNGDFASHSLKKRYSSFNLDKLIEVRSLENAGSSTTSDGTYISAKTPTFDAKQLPIAGNVWRYPTRYGWLGQLDRMFKLIGFNRLNKFGIWQGLQQEVFIPQYDNFIAQSIFNLRYYAPMLPIEDSFGTHDDDNEGETNMAVSKA